jgi:hypothetical protein
MVRKSFTLHLHIVVIACAMICFINVPDVFPTGQPRSFRIEKQNLRIVDVHWTDTEP